MRKRKWTNSIINGLARRKKKRNDKLEWTNDVINSLTRIRTRKEKRNGNRAQ